MTIPAIQPDSPAEDTRALVVDDEAIVCESCRRILMREGLVVDTCTDSSTGLRLAELGEYQILLLDVRMPGIDGVHFLRRLREVRPTMPVIVITGHASELSTRSLADLGVRELVAKPFAPSEVSKALKRVLDGRSLGRVQE